MYVISEEAIGSPGTEVLGGYGGIELRPLFLTSELSPQSNF